MNNRIQAGLYAIMIALLVMASAFTVIPAKADDGAPPPPAAPSAPSSKSTNAPSSVSQVPSGTGVVVVDRSGHKVALATQEAAHIVADSDPMWCPAGVVPGGAGCHSYTSFNDLINLYLYVYHPALAGVIWISKTYDSSTAVGDTTATSFTLDGTGLVNMKLHPLTINGGWTGVGSALTSLDPSEINGASLNILNWQSAVTVNNMKISSAPIDATLDPALNPSDPSGNGLTITIKITGNIVLNNVDVIASAGDGANLDNCALNNGTNKCTAAGTVAVNYSTFDSNGHIGLNVSSNRAITARNITAVNNINKGAYLDNYVGGSVTGSIAQPVTLTSINTFNYNGEDGLDVNTRGAITVGNLTALNNVNQGVYLNNCFDNVGLFTCANGVLNGKPAAYNVIMRGTNLFTGNGANGLTVWATGLITINNLNSNGNQGYGAYLSNFDAGVAGKYVSITGTNTMNGNGYSGLWVDTKGTANASNVTGNGNGLKGNCTLPDNCDGIYVTDASGLTLTGYGNFNNNLGLGMYIFFKKGPITLTNINANGNQYQGAELNNCGDVNYTSASCLGGGNLTLNGTNSFSNNGRTGLWVYTYGVVTLNNVTASYNSSVAHDLISGSGAQLINCKFNFGSFTCGNTTPYGVVLKGMNNFNGNYINGLTIYTQGGITASSVEANDNSTGYGALLKNAWVYKVYNITLTGVNSFSNNALDGLDFLSSGAFTLTQVTASNNTAGDGIQGTAASLITLTCGSLSSNGASGLNLSNPNNRAITLKGIYSGLTAGNIADDVLPALTGTPHHIPFTIVRACPLP